jgi:Ger(x)C family germination protein
VKLAKLFLVLNMCLLLLTSCIDDAREIDHRSMIVGMAIDKVKNDENEDLFAVTVQIPLILSGGGEEGGLAGSINEFETVTAVGETILDAIAQIEAMTPTVVFFGHLKVVTISEELARHGLNKVIDFFDRLPQVANQIYLLVVQEITAEDFISQESPLVALPSLYLNRFFQADQKISRTKDVKLFEYRRDSNMISGAAILPLAKIDEDKKIVIEGMGVFDDHKLVAKLINAEVGVSELLKNNKVSDLNYTTTIYTNNREEKVSISRGDLKAKISYEKKNPVTINVKIKGKGEITEIGNTNVKVTNELIKKVGVRIEKNLEDLVRETISNMQEKNVEPWLIGHRLWAMDHQFFDTLNWEESGWKDSIVDVSVEFEIEHTGQKGYLGKTKIGR